MPADVGYRIDISRGRAMPPTGDHEPNDGAETATPLEGGFVISGDSSAADADWYAWTVPATDPGTAWTIEADGVVGAGLSLTLQTPDGTNLPSTAADAGGHIMVPDLRLLPGTYRLQLSSGGDTASPYRLAAAPGPAEGDPEPDDLPALAVPLDAARMVAHGRLFPDGDRDLYAFTVPGDAPPVYRDIKLLSPEGGRYGLCLMRDDVQLQCRADSGSARGSGNVLLQSLLLAPGAYVVEITGEGAPDRSYVLRIDPTTAPAPDYEAEPNDVPEVATPFDASVAMRGRAAPGDSDAFRLRVGGQPQLWEVRASGSWLDRLVWTRADGTVLGDGWVAEDHMTALLTDMYLVPGEHWIQVEGAGDYVLRVMPLGPPDPDAEREPNDQATFAMPIRLARHRVVGRLVSPSDTDVFRFSLAGTERIVLRVDPPDDGAVDLRLENSGQRIGQIAAGGARPADGVRGAP